MEEVVPMPRVVITRSRGLNINDGGKWLTACALTWTEIKTELLAPSSIYELRGVLRFVPALGVRYTTRHYLVRIWAFGRTWIDWKWHGRAR